MDHPLRLSRPTQAEIWLPGHLLKCLEGKNLVNELADRTGLLEAKALSGLLETANHGRRTTEKNLDIVGGLGQVFVDHVGSDIANATGPTLRRLVKNVVHPDTSVLGSESVEVLLEKNVLGGNVGEDQVDFSLVASSSATNDSTDNLEHGGDSGTTSDHTKVSDHVRGVNESTFGTSDLDGLANSQGSHVLGDIASRVGFDQKVDVAGLVITGNGSVGADNLLYSAVGLGARSTNGDVLTDGKTENVLGAGKFEAVDGDVVRHNGLLLKLKFLENIRLKGLLDLEGQEVVDAEGNGDESSVRSPLLLDNQSANDEKQTRRVDIVDVVFREKRVVVARRGHGGALSSPPWNHAIRMLLR
jgi:hypothetical protein